MGKNKKVKFAEYDSFSNTFDHSHQTKGKWSEIFGNTHPITLELACGKGDYTLGLAKLFPNRNFIGIDIKGNRLWKGAKTALESGLKNVAFLRIQIDYIEQYFEKDEIEEIWITFADPQPGKVRKRLTHPKFIQFYSTIAKPHFPIHLKTDSDLLYEFTLETIAEMNYQLIENISNVYALKPVPEILQIQTFYEKIWLEEGRTIKYVKFQVN